jgi:hypothetical protein
MTAPSKPDPLKVECPYCSAIRFSPCSLFDRRARCWWGYREPHAARVRRAEKEARNDR